MIELSAFDDHLAFLNAIVDEEARTTGKVSLDRFAKAFGMSRSALSMLLNGHRPLTLPVIHRIAQALKLDQGDHECFEALVLKCQAETEFERHYYEQKLLRHRAERKTQTISTPSRTLVSEWFVPALLVYLIDVSDKPDDLRTFAQRFGLGDQELQDVLEALRAEGFLAYKGRGNVHIAFNRVAAMISSQRYIKAVHGEGLRQAERHFSNPLCFFAAHCFSIAESDIAAFISEYKDLLNKYMSTTPQAGASAPKVVQANLQFFPVG